MKKNIKNRNTVKERRGFPRINAKFPIRYKIKRGGFVASALTQDLSLSGARLNTDRVFPQGLNLNLELNILSKIINPVGRVVWSQSLARSSQYQIGIEFVEINSQDRNYFSDYINTRTSEFSESRIK